MEEQIVKLSKRRFVILITFWALLGLQLGSVYEYAIIANIVMNYYDVSMNAVNMATVSGNILYLVLLLPSTYSIKRLGVRKNVTFSASLLFLGCLVKCLSARRHLFPVVVVGNFISAASMSFSYPLFFQIALSWFPSEKMSTISSIIYSSFIIGSSIVAFVIAQVVPEADVVTVESNLENFLFGQAAVACLILLSVIVFFREKPKYPPSAVEVQAAQNRNSLPFWESVRKVLNRNFVLILITATLSNSLMIAYTNIGNQIFVQFFFNKVSILGIMMLVSSLFSVISMIVFGFLFDKYKCHKLACIISIIALGVINAVSYVGYRYECIEVIFVTHAAGAIMITGLFGLNFLAPEVNYPLPESISVTMFSIVENLGASFFTFTMTSIINRFGIFAVYAFITSMFVIAMIAICSAKIELKRTAVEVALREANGDNEDAIASEKLDGSTPPFPTESNVKIN